jgi:hypothetical protein
MDLVTFVTICNFLLSLAMIAITIATIRFRRQIVGLTNFLDRCLDEWQRLEIDSVAVTAANRIQHLRQIYQQQLTTLDRLQQLQSLFGVARFFILKRR